MSSLRVDWEGVLLRSEKEGMTPLVIQHLRESQGSCPEHIQILLEFLDKRYKHHATIRLQVLREVLGAFASSHLTPLLIKGAALCHIAYPDPVLRPMRDMDILFNKSEAPIAQKILQSLGFNPSVSPIPADHYHLPALLKTVQGMPVCIEIHHGLYPDCPPYYPEVNFEKLLATAREISIDGIVALTLGDTETLHYLYQHAFRAPLAYESYKLINVADITSFTEKFFHNIDWSGIRREYPLVFNAIPLLHHISPWDFEKIPREFVSERDHRRRLKPQAFAGWPNRKLKELQADGLGYGKVLYETFVPSSWWLRVFYGVTTRCGLLRAAFITHPRQVFWWLQLYSQFLKPGDHPLSMATDNHPYPLVRRMVVWKTRLRERCRKMMSKA